MTVSKIKILIIDDIASQNLKAYLDYNPWSPKHTMIDSLVEY